MSGENNIRLYKKLDWWLVGSFLFLIIFGWLNIYSALHTDESHIIDFSQKYGVDIIWMAIACIIAALILFVIPSKAWNIFAWWGYAFTMLLLIAVLFFGKEINGSKSWLEFKVFNMQPAEFSKITTSLALATLMGKYGYHWKNPRDMMNAFAVIGIPMLMILLEHETGLMLVYGAFLLVFYREGMSGWILLLGIYAVVVFIATLVFSPYVSILITIGVFMGLIGFNRKNTLPWLVAAVITITLLAFFPRLLKIEKIAAINPFEPEIWLALVSSAIALFFVFRIFWNRLKLKFVRNALLCFVIFVAFSFCVEVIFEKVLGDHQRARIELLLGMRDDPKGVGYNQHQSLIAIGSGGFHGKGYLHGTQTRFNFVPEQSTDFIFCTIGEEWGFMGSIAILAVYLLMIIRILNAAEKNADAFVRIYGYCVACCLLMHVAINISMTIGLMPVIGIPLPFLSYGGSSMLAFTILLFIFIRLDLERKRYGG